MNIIGKRKYYYLISAILIIPGIIALFLWGLKPGIDFSGGTILEVKFTDPQNSSKIKDSLKNENLKDLSVLSTGQGTYMIKTAIIDENQHTKITESLAKVGENKEILFETVGPTVSADLRKKAIIAVAVASIAIILYIAFAFRKIQKPSSSWRFGISAVIALIHDLAFVIGVWAILGHFLGYEIDSLFITALLTIMGFSVHDTIVVFDRIRENLRKFHSLDFETNVNNSILQTLNRSLNTSLTVLIVLACLYFLGGNSLKHFMLALLLGIAIGTYSSIFNASAVLVSWQGWVQRRIHKKNAS